MRKGMGFSFTEPPPRLTILFSGVEVAELTQKKKGGSFIFQYTPAFKQLELTPLPGLQDLDRRYESDQLWPYVAERIPDMRRPEIRSLVEQRGLQQASELRLLAELGAHSVTDPFQIETKKIA